MEFLREQFNQVARAIAELARRVRRLETLANFAPTTIAGGEVEEGPGIDIPPGTVRIGVGDDSILLVSDTQQPAAEYGFGPTGLSQALSAAGVGDQVRIQGVGTIGGAQTIGASREVAGLGFNTVLSGAIANSGILSNLRVSGTVSPIGRMIGVVLLDDNFVASGRINTITQVAAGAGNVIENVIGGGVGNQITDVGDSVIGGGSSNIIQSTGGANDFYSTIGGGASSLIQNSEYAGIGGGDQASIYNSDYAHIGGGGLNFVRFSEHSSIVGGENNRIDSGAAGPDDTFGSFIGGGAEHDIAPPGAGSAFYSVIVGGNTNVIFNGTYAFIGGGQFNAVRRGAAALDSDYSLIIGGFSNTIYDSEYCVVVGGRDNDIGASGTSDACNYSAIVGGQNHNILSSDWGVIGGGYDHLIDTADYAGIFSGRLNTVTADYGAILGGYQGVVDKYGQEAYAAGAFATAGDAQHNNTLGARRSVTHSDANWYELYLDGTNPSLATIPADTVWAFTIRIAGTTQGCTESFDYEIKGTIENDGGTTTILAQTVTIIYEDTATFDARVSADDTNDALLVEVSDNASGGSVVRWVARIDFVQVTFPA